MNTPDADDTPRPDDRRAFLRVAALLAGVNTVLTLTTAFSTEKLNFLYKDRLGLDAGAFATLGILLLLPSYLRPILGSLADVFPLWGWHRKSYFAVGVGLNALGYAALAALGPRFAPAPVVAGALLSLTGLYLRLVVTEAVLVRAGNALGRLGQLQTLWWLVPSAMTILWGARLSGFVTQHWSYAACFRAAALSALLALPLVRLMDETRAVSGAGAAERRRQSQADRARTRLALREGLGSRGLWSVIGFVFALQLTPKVGAAQFFYTVDALRFSKQLIGDLGAWTSAGEIIGIAAFGLLAPRVPVRALVWGVVALAVAAYVPQFWLRDARSAALVGLLSSALGIMVNLVITTLAARACPPRIEAMVFGLVLAASTLGGALSAKIGAALYQHFGTPGHWRFGWDALLWLGMAGASACALFLPFLPAWTRSAEPLRARRE